MTATEIFKICRLSFANLTSDIIAKENAGESVSQLRDRGYTLLYLLKQVGRKFNEVVVDEVWITQALELTEELLDGYLIDGLPSFTKPLISLGRDYTYTNLPSRENATGSSVLGKTLTVRGTQYGSLQDNTDFPPDTLIVDVLAKMLNKVIHPTYSMPTFNLSRGGVSNYEEVGKNVEVTLTPSFVKNDAGAISAYSLKMGNEVLSTNLGSYKQTLSAITAGTKSYSATVSYNETPVESYKLNNVNEPDGTLKIASGSIARNQSFEVIYPILYGTIKGDRPNTSTINYNNLLKRVEPSSGNVTINFNSANDDYLVFVLPSSVKTKWKIDELNKGSIGGAAVPSGNLFPTPELVTVTTALWTKQCYVYVSNYKTALGGLLLE